MLHLNSKIDNKNGNDTGKTDKSGKKKYTTLFLCSLRHGFWLLFSKEVFLNFHGSSKLLFSRDYPCGFGMDKHYIRFLLKNKVL